MSGKTLLVEPGAIFANRYRVVEPIGQGGMGRVYMAEDLRLEGRLRALKLIATLPEEREAFIREARMLCRLTHPNIPEIVDYYSPNEDGVAAIVMDYIAGDTLAQRFDKFGRKLSFGQVLQMTIQLCEVLQYLHGQAPAIVYRDLKPSNVIIDSRDRAVLVDFGIARWHRPNAVSDTLQLGTPGFASPEQLLGKQSDERSDLYGLGALVYFLLTGGFFAIRRNRHSEKFVVEAVPRAFREMVELLLSEDPSHRPKSAASVLEHLLNIRELGASGEGSFRFDASKGGGNSFIKRDVTIAAVLSAYPGAGATFVTLALSSALSIAGVDHAVVECPGGEAEMYGLLDGARKMPARAQFANGACQRVAGPIWREGRASYVPLDPFRAAQAQCHCVLDESFVSFLQKLGAPLVLLDVSSRWEHPDAKEWIGNIADSIIWVADCYPSKWSLKRQQEGASLYQAIEGRQAAAIWIANRDHSFAERKEWLSMFPVAPLTALPRFSEDAVLKAIWDGAGVPSAKKDKELYFRSLKTVLKRIVPAGVAKDVLTANTAYFS
ncbi:serine/threonine-protein kinase [Cohnella faecalis]|uniref:Serine/threonine protein kinase n=1 Tax=Cohnella faecalis TaxID=2315694 RepID=A0A398CQH8_9BACL|nr:serine/threonine-protein kinase [Cohnella faecalis]RIE04783.1 serine/threonine protein kinase [Cohnella faecalis]